MVHSLIILFLNLGSGEVFLIVLVVLLFFGSDKIPEIARAFGKGMQEMKNATAEIQREIEKGATDIQRDINIKDGLDELKDATNSIKANLTEGISNIEKHYNDDTKTDAPDQGEAATPENNSLVPPDAIKRD